MAPHPNDSFWLKRFGDFFTEASDIADLTSGYWASTLNYSKQAVHGWRHGRRLPGKLALDGLCGEFGNLNLEDSQYRKLFNLASHTFEGTAYERYVLRLRETCRPSSFASECLRVLWMLTRGLPLPELGAEPTGTTRAVIFDFDGTLVREDKGLTTWESLWVALGYSARECQVYHQKFNMGKISHEEWCSITERHFKARGLRKEQVEALGRKMTPLPGLVETFRQLAENGVDISIVSGSIHDVIRVALGEALAYVDEVRCNRFFYTPDGKLDRIVGTTYDFEGKAAFIKERAAYLGVSTSDALFVGNSVNDRFAYMSGAHTLCINPRQADVANTRVWNYTLETCDDLRDVLKFVEYAQ